MYTLCDKMSGNVPRIYVFCNHFNNYAIRTIAFKDFKDFKVLKVLKDLKVLKVFKVLRP
jgi:hypothetical protein